MFFFGVLNNKLQELLERQMSANELNSLQNKIDKQLEHRSVAREPEKVGPTTTCFVVSCYYERGLACNLI